MAETAEQAKERILREHQLRQGTAHTIKPEGSPVGDDEPTFTFRAQDLLSVLVLAHYAELVEMYTSGGGQLTQVIDMNNQFREWQRANPGKVKLPD